MAAREKIPKSFVTTQEAAHLLGVSLRTVQLWTESGLLTCWKTGGGHRRIPRDAVARLLLTRPTPAAPVPASPETTGETASAPRPFHILVVEDDPTLSRLYRLQLARWALKPTVTTAANGFEALVRLGGILPDLLIADLHMPEMDGFQMLRTLRTMPELDTVEIVVVSGLDPAEIVERGGLPDGIPVLPKPIPFAELETIAEEIAAQHGRQTSEAD